MPYFHELNRSVQDHTECILFAFLQDANGAPVPGVKCKIWGGPPPTGEPPYFVDDDPNNPNRRTDANGKFQFIVAAGPVGSRTDFFFQTLDANNRPSSDRLQFTFPEGEAQWVTVTLAPRALPLEPPAPPASAPEELPEFVPGQPVVPLAAEAAPAAPLAPGDLKLLDHYVLLGAHDAPGTLTNLILALDYIVHFAPASGFSPDEAKHARRVTILGDAHAVAADVETALREAGCEVTRLTASDSYALERLLRERIASNSP